MFDSAQAATGVVDAPVAGAVPAGLSSDVLAGLISDNHTALLAAETRVLLLAAAWADAHDLDPAREGYQPLVERACAWGGEGTPQVSEYCAVELGALQRTGSTSARMLIADALDLRHRLPRLWAQVRAGQVRAWQARKVAEATRTLPWTAVQQVDDTTSGYLGMLPWARFQRVLDAAILRADPAQAAERDQRARTGRDVWAADSEDGLKTLIARATSGDVIWFMAAVNRIADILHTRGDTDPVGARRAKAIGILAHPAQALALLADHRHDPAPPDHPTEPDQNEPEWEPEPGTDPAHSDHDLIDEDVYEGEEVDEEPSTGFVGPTAAQLAASRPTVVLHFHLSDDAIITGNGIVRPEHGTPLSLNQLHQFLTDTGCRIQVRPVIDPALTAPVDAYETPLRLRAATRYRHVADVFPYGTSTSTHLDLDHTRPYQPDGPPGQTGLHNLGPLTRSHHRAVTHGHWQRRQPTPGTYLYRSPTGYTLLVTNHGTLDLGRNPWTDTLWHTNTPEHTDTPC